MTGSLATKNGKYYVVLNLYVNGKRKKKWIGTNLPETGNRRKAEQILRGKQDLARQANRIFDRIFPDQADDTKHGAFFRSLPLPPHCTDGIKVEELLAQNGVSVYHSNRFAVQKFTESPFLRLSVSSAGSDELLEQGLTITRDAISKL